MITAKDIALYPLRITDAFLDRVFAAAGAIAFAQFPQFVAQYIQRLGGHVDEAARNVSQYRATAESAGKSLDLFIRHLSNSPDIAIAKLAEKISTDVQRLEYLQRALKELESATVFNKLPLFIKNVDMEIAAKTLKNFTPGVPVTAEGIAYAAAGMICAMILYFLLKKTVTAIFHKIRGR